LTRLIALALAVILNSVSTAVVVAQTEQGSEAKRIVKAKQVVHKLGIGREARVAITRTDQTTVSGFISEASESSFELTDFSTGATTQLTYAEVEKAKPLPTVRNDLTTKRAIKQVGLALGIGVGVLVLACLLTRRCEE